MKTIISILIGVIIGSSATFYLKPNPKPEFSEPPAMLFETLGMSEGEMEVKDLSTDELLIGLWENNSLSIVSKKNPEKKVLISPPPRKDIMTNITITDRSGQSFNFVDKNSDGRWDFSYLEGNGTVYIYNGIGGYPGRVIIQGKPPLARVDGEYFNLKLIDEKRFIEKGNELIEVVMISPGLISIKEEGSSPTNLNSTGSELERFQQEVIRKGMPALPIPLTKEMDDQLVREGILPPQ